MQVEKLKTDIQYFGKELLKIDLWSHQVEFLTCPAKVVCVASGRQIGKSTALAVLSLFRAFVKRSVIVIVSPSDSQSKLMLKKIKELLEGNRELLQSSVVDDNKSYIRLTNGSEIYSLVNNPQTIRGYTADLVICDECSFFPEETFRAVKFSILAKPEAQIFCVSTPFNYDSWFKKLYDDGMAGKNQNIQSFHYTYEVSPLIDKKWVKEQEEQTSEIEYRTEILGEWIPDSDAYFDPELIMKQVRDYDMVYFGYEWNDEQVRLTGGIDWACGGSDYTVACFVGRVDTNYWDVWKKIRPSNHYQDNLFAVFLLDSWRPTIYQEVQQHIGEVKHWFNLSHVYSEQNGVGAFPTQQLSGQTSKVEGINTTNKTKADGYGMIKMLLQQGKLILPRNPELLRQLKNLRYEITKSKQISIAHSAHYPKDDYADALMLSVLSMQKSFLRKKTRMFARPANFPL